MTENAPPSPQAPTAPGETSDLVELLRRVRRLEMVARHNAASWLLGEYLTSIRGQGMVFHESRKYVAGEPARHIDWNVTARTGEPYVKVHLEERQRDVMVVLDVSPSMHTGFRHRTKLELGVELAATLAVAAQEAGDRVGHLLFADQVLAHSRPRGGRPQLFQILRSLLDHTQPWNRPVHVSDPRVAIHALQSERRGRFVVLLISDFIDHDLPDDLRYLRAHHDVSLLHVYDPVEMGSAPVRFAAHAPEGSPDSGHRGFLELGEQEDLATMDRFLRDQAGPLRIATASFATDRSVRSSLDAFFHRKRRLLARGR